jgi:hypothetical protein
MKFLNCNENELHEALKRTNGYFAGNIEFRELEQTGKRSFRGTLTVKDSRGPGSRTSPFNFNPSGNPHRIKAACWHVHGVFFDELMAVNEDVKIRSNGTKIEGGKGNWADRNIGSITYPVYYSEACDCNEKTEDGNFYKSMNKQTKK